MLLLSCGEGPVELRTDRSAYAAGDVVKLELHNKSLEGIRYNLCSVVFEPRIEMSFTACGAVAEGLGPSEVGRGEVRVPTDAPAGSYVLTTRVERAANDARVIVTSDAFDVTR